ncbi:hypothetical protein [Bradyrhizobium sp.]|uniref:hypothetical protein n=1 Tax=Bradyrhizobium sp. TaxID=376 RepID=UPI0025C5D6FC|nr:hypothetical protein [Bradyrhizobium sp.]
MPHPVQLHAAKRQTVDASEGIASYAEKRAANWGSGKLALAALRGVQQIASSPSHKA